MSQFPIQNQPVQQNQLGSWSPSAPDEPSESKFDFWGLLNRRKWLIFLGTLIGAGIGLLIHYKTETTYESYAEVLIEPKNPYRAAMGSTDPVLPGADAFTRRHDKIIDTKDFIEVMMQKNDYFKIMTSYANLDRSKAVNTALNALEVKPDREEPNKFRLSFKAKDQDESKLFLNSVITAYQTRLENIYSIETNRIAREFKNTTEKIETMLDKAKTSYEALRVKYPATIVNRNETIEQLKLKQLDAEITRAKELFTRKRSEQQWIMDAIQSGQPESEIVWILKNNRKVLSDEKDRTGHDQGRRETALLDQLNQLRIQKSALLERLGEGHPRIKDLNRQLDYYRELLESNDEQVNPNLITDDQKIRLYMSSVALEIQDLKQKLNLLVPEFARLKQTVNNISEGQYLLKRKDEEIAEIRDWLRQARTTLAKIDPDQLDQLTKTNKEGYRFSVLAKPDEGKPIWPRMEVLVPICSMAGMLLGFVLGYLVDIADKTYRNPDEITKQLNIPLIGHIPVISSSKRHLVEDSYVHPLVCTYHRPKAQSSEAFRAVRTALFFNTQGNTHSVIQITSPTPGDGKSTVAVNLAVSIAQAGKRVLLIDGDMRRPTVHHSFGIKSNDGFATILLGDCRIDDAIFDCEEIEGLSVMPCGKKPSNPAELITSPRFQSLIEEIREMFDYVIIDTPPILAVTDPCPVAARVDGVILTLRIKKNIKISSDRATNILQNVGANLIGVVVNGVGANTGYGSQYSYGAYRAGYSYNGYGYGYGYGYGNYYDDRKQDSREQQPNGPHRPQGQPQRIGHEVPAAAEPVAPSNNDQLDDLDLDL